MRCLILLFSWAALALSAACPKAFDFTGGVKNFGPWHANSNDHCKFELMQTFPSSFETIELSLANIGASETVTISSRNGSVVLTNRRYFKETIAIFNTWVIDIKTGPNTQLVMEFVGALEEANPPVYKSLEFPNAVRSFVFYMDEWKPYTAITFSSLYESNQMVIQKAELFSDPADILQWSNVLVYENKNTVGSLFNLMNDTGAYISSTNLITLYLSQPINFKSAIVITTITNVKAFDSYQVIYANPTLPTQTFAIGYANAKKSYVTVIGDRLGSTPIDIRTASSSAITVTEGGPNKMTTVALPLDSLPVSMSGNVWTFYLNQGSGVVKFSVGS